MSSKVLPKVSTVLKKIMMVRPTHFEVKYSINPWMDTAKPVDKTKALAQWNTLKDTIESVGGEVHVMESPDATNWPDIVFSANAAVIRSDKAYLANFFHNERKGERRYYQKWFEDNGFKTCGSTELAFEGAGDALWAGKGWNKLFVGVGPRSDVRVLPDIARQLDDGTNFHVIGCHLVDPRFYHIDVAFCPLEEELVLWFPGAFDPIAQHNMKNHGIEFVPITEKEAQGFACNAVVVGKTVIMHQGNDSVAKKLEKVGYSVQFVDMSEFLKSGGSAKCCTLQLP